MSLYTRRAVLAGGGSFVAAQLGGCAQRTAAAAAGRLRETRIGGMPIMLTAQERSVTLPGASGSTPLWLYGEEPFPVYRLRLGESLNATLVNRLREHTSVHWHGVRGPNAMDGVPYVTQMPVQPGETFNYNFTPPDAGTFFFHPHCNTAEQLGRGLSGVLIVEDAGEQFDDDIVCVLKDWRVDRNGGFLPFITAEGAARGGTFGTLRTLNAQASPEIAVPVNANIRLRLLNLDSTRVSDIGVQGADARVVAIDGNVFDGFVLDTWRLGPAMRMDLALRTPAEGGKVTVVDYFAQQPVTLATLVANSAAPSARGAATPVISRLALPDMSNAETHELKLSASATPSDYPDLPPIVLPDGHKIDLLDTLCSTTRTLWAIDGKPWPQTGHEHLPPPLMTLARGTTVRLQLTNTTPHVHPMHVHGHTFKVLSASKLKRPEHWADTVLVLPEERVEIAFVADNPGNWMIHCHIVEHQDTGMMGWFRVV
jgi:FtsP/CotA-like multicopper oxidase with cupredoxin domain